MARMIPRYASSQAEIERSAREIFEQAGCPTGRDLDHWLRAEAYYGERLRRQSAQRAALFNRDDWPPAG